VGVGLVYFTGWLILDPIVAILVALHIVWTGWGLIARSFQGLMDRAVPDEEQAKIREVLETVKDRGCDYHALRTRVAGAKSFVDVHILVTGSMSVQEGHDLVEQLENDIQAKLPHVEVLTHLEPLEDPKSWDDPEKPLAGS
jgi:cation diffusion facilitator family transporter